MKVTIRPNLNTGRKFDTTAESTIHAGRLGRKLGSQETVSIICTDTVVRPAGQQSAQEDHNKTVHAGLIGELLDQVIMPLPNSPRVEYNPHRGDTFFSVNGEVYVGGGVVTSIGHRSYLVAQ
tara:strand:+ start:153 stop:518 length:366 start_codon:yes stop_codon:yes gene_type:complete